MVALCFGLWVAWASVIVSGSLPLLRVLCSEWEGGFLGEAVQDRIKGPFQNQLLEIGGFAV